MSEHDDGFLKRWSKLKQTGEAADQLTQTPLPAELPEAQNADTNPVANVGETEVEEALLTDADMPPVESLTESSDFSQFLSEGVSDALRRKALRKLFALPEFNIRDGLNDYDDDFSEFIPLGDTVTYQMKQWLKQEAEAAAKAITDDEAGQSVAGSDQQGVAANEHTAQSSEAEDVSDDDDDHLGEADG